MSLFAPFALLAAAMVVGSAVVALVRTGPLGVVAAVVLVVGTAVGLRLGARALRRWWREMFAAATAGRSTAGRPGRSTAAHPPARKDRPPERPTSAV